MTAPPRALAGESAPPTSSMQSSSKDFWKLFKPSACNLRMKGATKETVFEELVDNLVKAKLLDDELRPAALEALANREELASTGVGQNVAIPHVKLEGIDEVLVSLSIHENGVPWNSLDGEDAHIFFLVVRPAKETPKYDPERHLEMMRWISQLGRVGDFRNFARRVANRTELVELLREMSEGAPEGSNG